MVNGGEWDQGADSFLHPVGRLPGYAFGISDKDAAGIDIIPVLQAIFYILEDDLVKISPVFLSDRHFAVDHFDARLQVQKIRTESRQRGAASSLGQIIQLVDDETGLRKTRLCHDGVVDILCGVCAFHGHGSGIQNKVADAGGKIPAVHHIDILDFFRKNIGEGWANYTAPTDSTVKYPLKDNFAAASAWETNVKDETLHDTGYLFYDVNGDDVPELFIASLDEDFPGFIEMYTYYDDEIRHLVSSADKTGYHIGKDEIVYA